MLDRRTLLKLLALSPLAGAATSALGSSTSSARAGRWRRRLVLVEMQGGNDGLNTVVPFADKRYRALRPSLALDEKDAVGLGRGLALAPALAPLAAALEAGELGVVLGVGYPHPVRSHFRSQDIWHTGSGSGEARTDGWVARVAGAAAARTGAPARGLVVGGDPGPLDGPGFDALAADDDKTSRRTARPAVNAALAHLARVHEEVRAAHKDIEAAVHGELPAGAQKGKAFRQQCRVAARALSRLDVAVVKLTIGSFDTHVSQRARQDRLLAELAAGLAELRELARADGVWDDTLVATTSEFGRRAKENGSGGTDHGTAAPLFVLGGRVRGGLHGTQPSLDDLDGEGDLRFTTDYRAVLGGLAVAAWSVRPADAAAALGGLHPLALTHAA